MDIYRLVGCGRVLAVRVKVRVCHTGCARDAGSGATGITEATAVVGCNNTAVSTKRTYSAMC